MDRRVPLLELPVTPRAFGLFVDGQWIEAGKGRPGVSFSRHCLQMSDAT